jgi:hypothetical protein
MNVNGSHLNVIDHLLSPRGSPLSTIWTDRNNFTGTPFSNSSGDNDLRALSTPAPEINIAQETGSEIGDETLPIEQGEEALMVGQSAVGAIEDLVDPAMILGQIVQAGATGISTAEDQSALTQGRADLINAENTGHGIGWQNVAQNNFNNVQNSVNLHQGLQSALGFLGPLGSIIGTMLPPTLFQGPQQSSYMVQTTSGQSVDAQSSDIINTT